MLVNVGVCVFFVQTAFRTAEHRVVFDLPDVLKHDLFQLLGVWLSREHQLLRRLLPLFEI